MRAVKHAHGRTNGHWRREEGRPLLGHAALFCAMPEKHVDSAGYRRAREEAGPPAMEQVAGCGGAGAGSGMW